MDSLSLACSCGQRKLSEQADVLTLTNRRWMALRYTKVNVHAQCRSCNRFDEGGIWSYTRFMLKTYGEDLLEHVKNHTNGRIAS